MIHTTLMGVVDGASATVYGIPFIGRREELQAIRSFCEEVGEEEELAVCWIQGEAGIGKSALMREAERELKRKDRIVISVCLYPDSVESVFSLVCDTLNARSSTTRLLTREVTQSLPSLLAALRRLARLRPLSLLLEDLHLMSDESCTELLSLLHGLRNESVAILCVSRITDGENYARLLPYIRTTLELSPLTSDEVEELTASTLGQSGITGERLYRASRGYPLILQAMIMELQALSEPDRGKLQRKQEALIRNRAALSIRGLTTPFLSGLTDEEKKGTGRLAALGEQFSRQAAEVILQEKSFLIDRLLEKGVLLRSTTFSLPIYGSYESTLPYRFNHTLLFEGLLEEATIAEEEIIRVIEQNAPLYTLTLFQQLDRCLPESLDPGRLERAIGNLTQAARGQELRLASDRKLADQFYRHAQALYRRHEGEFEPGGERRLLLELSATAVYLFRQQVFTQGHPDRLEEFTRLTESPESEEVAIYRCMCLSNRLLHYQHNEVPHVLAEVEYLSNEFPSLLENDEFIRALANLGWTCTKVDDTTVLPRIRRLFERVIGVADPGKQTASLVFAGTQILFAASTMAEVKEELEEAVEFSYHLHALLAPHCNEREALTLESVRAYVFHITGHLSEVVKTLHRYRGDLLHSRDVALLHLKRILLATQASVGVPTSILESQYLEHLGEIRDMVGGGVKEENAPLPRLQWILGIEPLMHGYMRGELEWGERLSSHIIDGNAESTRTVMPINRAAAKGERELLRPFIDDIRFGTLVRAALEEIEDTTEVLAGVRSFLERGVINMATLLELQTVLDLVRMAREISPAQEKWSDLTNELANGVRGAIDWCIKRQVPGFAAPFLNAGASLFAEKEHARLSEKIEKLIAEMPNEIGLHELVRKGESDDRIRLSVIGSISASGSRSEPEQRFQGGRVRRAVAMIAATWMMKRPLSLPEFRHILTGMAADSEKAASYTRTLLWRIRSILGPDSIIADGEGPPRFDTTHIRVDLFDAALALDRCERALREVRPRQAREAVMSALQIVGDGPIYPTLYDEFFEASRLDFEVRLRDGVRSTVTLLRREGDMEEAERLLRTALYTLPGDDELIEEQVEMLQLLGRNAEAVALRQKTERTSAAA